MCSNNDKALRKLITGLQWSQGELRPFLARYSDVSQRDRLIKELRKSFPGVLAELQLNEHIEEIYATIIKYLEDKQPDALMVWGWEFSKNTDELLKGIEYVREDFRNYCPLPIVFWVDAEVSAKFARLIPNFNNWTSLTQFEPTKRCTEIEC